MLPLDTNLLYDSPLILPEQDRLDRTGFAQALAQVLARMDASEPFIFALQGPGGSGKSTILNFVQHYLEHPGLLGLDTGPVNPVTVIRYNPWWFSGSDRLTTEFFRSVRAQIAKGADLSADIKSLADKLQVLGNCIAPESGSDSFQDVNAARQEISDFLRQLDLRLLIVLDDLDRLRPEELLRVFQIVKAVADFPKTIYLLAFDQQAVHQVLSDAGVKSPETLLDQIVQSQFDLPPPDKASLRELLEGYLDRLVKTTPPERWNRQRWVEYCSEGLDRLIGTARDVKHLIDAIRPAYAAVAGDVDFVDFVAVQSVRVFAPSLFRFTLANKAILTSDLSAPSKVQTEKKVESKRLKVIMDQELSAVREECRAAIDYTMRCLFPVWAITRDGRSPASRDQARPERRDYRVSSADGFDFYFRLAIPNSAVSPAELWARLESAAEPKDLVNYLRECRRGGLQGRKKLEAFLDQVRDQSQDIRDELIPGFLETVFVVGDELYTRKESAGSAYTSNDWQLLRIARQLVSRTAAATRLQAVKDAFQNGAALSLMTRFVMLHRSQEKRRDALLKADELTELQHSVVERIRAAAEKEELLATPYLDRVLLAWRTWGNADEAAEYLRSVVEDEQKFAALFVAAHCDPAVVDGESGRVSVSNTSELALWTGLTLEELGQRCSCWLADQPSWMDAEYVAALEAFQQQAQRDLAGVGDAAD